MQAKHQQTSSDLGYRRFRGGTKMGQGAKLDWGAVAAQASPTLGAGQAWGGAVTLGGAAPCG